MLGAIWGSIWGSIWGAGKTIGAKIIWQIVIWFLIFIILVLCGFMSLHQPKKTYEADHFATKLEIKVNANQTAEDYLDSASFPQIVKWQYSGYVINGNKPIQGTIEGKWFPLGGKSDSDENIELPLCQLEECDPSKGDKCYSKSKDNGGISAKDEILRKTSPACYLSRGQGLYAAIQIPSVNEVQFNNNGDINSSAAVSAVPSSEYYRVWRMSDFVKCDGDGEKCTFSIDHTNKCILKKEGKNKTIECQPDTLSTDDSIKTVASGKLYFKFLAGDYSSADGEYTINLTSGATKFKSFSAAFHQLYSILTNSFTTMQKVLYQYFTKDLFQLAQIAVILSVMFHTINFILGNSRNKLADIIVNLLKMSFVLLLTSPKLGYAAVEDYLLPVFVKLPQHIAVIIVDGFNALAINNVYNNNFKTSTDTLSVINADAGYLLFITDFMENLFDEIVIEKINSLIWSRPFYFLGLYLLWLMMLMPLVKSLSLFLLSLVRITLLIILLPLFIILMLFRATANMYQTWLKNMIASGILIFMNTACIGLFLSMTQNSFKELLYFKISPKEGGFSFLQWRAYHIEGADLVLNANNYVMALFSILLLNYGVSKVTEITDAITEIYQGSTSSMAGRSMSNIQATGSWMYSKIDGTRAMGHSLMGSIGWDYNPVSKSLISHMYDSNDKKSLRTNLLGSVDSFSRGSSISSMIQNTESIARSGISLASGDWGGGPQGPEANALNDTFSALSGGKKLISNLGTEGNFQWKRFKQWFNRA